MRKALAGLMFAALLAATPHLIQAQPTPIDSAMKKLADGYMQAWARGDGKAVAAFYTPDAIWIGSEGQVGLGRAEIEKAFIANFAGPWKKTKITITQSTAHSLSPTIRVSDGTYEVVGVKDPSGKAVPVKGRYLNTLVESGGRWWIAGNAAVSPQGMMATP